jgi:hypothetical protein
VTTRTRLYLSGYSFCILMMPSVFSKPLHIPGVWAVLLDVAAGVALAVSIRLDKKLKLERQPQPAGEISAAGQG